MAEDDPFELSRFVAAQDLVFETVLAELRAGRKETRGCGSSSRNCVRLDGLPPRTSRASALSRRLGLISRGRRSNPILTRSALPSAPSRRFWRRQAHGRNTAMDSARMSRPSSGLASIRLPHDI